MAETNTPSGPRTLSWLLSTTECTRHHCRMVTQRPCGCRWASSSAAVYTRPRSRVSWAVASTLPSSGSTTTLTGWRLPREPEFTALPAEWSSEHACSETRISLSNVCTPSGPRGLDGAAFRTTLETVLRPTPHSFDKTSTTRFILKFSKSI